MSEGGVCPGCGAARPWRYCASCGEKRVEASDPTVRSFLGYAFGESTNLDAKLLCLPFAEPAFVLCDRLVLFRVAMLAV